MNANDKLESNGGVVPMNPLFRKSSLDLAIGYRVKAESAISPAVEAPFRKSLRYLALGVILSLGLQTALVAEEKWHKSPAGVKYQLFLPEKSEKDPGMVFLLHGSKGYYPNLVNEFKAPLLAGGYIVVVPVSSKYKHEADRGFAIAREAGLVNTLYREKPGLGHAIPKGCSEEVLHWLALTLRLKAVPK